MEEMKNLDKKLYELKKLERKRSKYPKESGRESKTKLTEEEYKLVYDVMFFELGGEISKKFFDLITSLIEDKKNYILLSEKHGALVERLPTIKEGMKKEILKEYTQKITSLENKITNTQNEVSKFTESNEYLKDIEKQFKQFIICHNFEDRKELLNKSLEFILELFETTKKIRAEKRIEGYIGKKVELPQELSSYIIGSLCVCGSLKSKNSKGCGSCRLKADSGRKKNNQSMELSWKEVWNSFGYCPNEDMEERGENN